MKHRLALIILLFFCALIMNSCESTTPVAPDTEPPVFAGVNSIKYTTGPIPYYYHFILSWEAATDNVTSQDKIDYLIYFDQGTSESIDYSTPYFTTEAGVISQKVAVDDDPDYLPWTLYFSVRARDEAGNIDTNTKVVSFEIGPY